MATTSAYVTKLDLEDAFEKFYIRMEAMVNRVVGDQIGEIVGEALELIETRFDGVEHWLENVEFKLDGVEFKLGGVEHRLGRLEDSFDVRGKRPAR